MCDKYVFSCSCPVCPAGDLTERFCFSTSFDVTVVVPENAQIKTSTMFMRDITSYLHIYTRAQLNILGPMTENHFEPLKHLLGC